MSTGTGTWEGNLSSASSQATLDSPGQSLKAHEVSRQLLVRAHPTGTERGGQSSSHPRWASGGLHLVPGMVTSEYCSRAQIISLLRVYIFPRRQRNRWMEEGPTELNL